MKIAILTQPLRYNYGGILQNFALQTVLRKMGHQVVTLDPQRYKYTWWQHLLRVPRHMVGRYVIGHVNTTMTSEWLADKKTRKQGTNTFEFIDKYIKRKEYRNLFEDVSPYDYDVFVVGSDQVWRPEYNKCQSNMFLDFTRGWEVRRIAYAASFGVDTWSADASITEKCREGLQNFDLVTVREDSGIAICMQLFGIEAQQVLDPTLLLTKEDYVSLLHLDDVPKSKGNLLVYILDYTDDKVKLVQRITNEYHLVPFRVNSDVENHHLTDLSKRIQPPVEQWLRGFYDADYIVTDSYHACIFSIIFRKPFVVYGNQYRGLTRYKSLLCQLSLMDSLILSSEEFRGFNLFSQKSIAELDRLCEKSYNILDTKV